MASKRNRILELAEYMESCGIKINIGKNKARGNKGYFRATASEFRIDIARDQDEETILKTLAHEFAHFVHYNYDKTLNSLEFLLDDTDDMIESLISITVESIPQESVRQIFEQKEHIKSDIKDLNTKLKNFNTDSKTIESKIKKTPLKYLLKYDRVQVMEGFHTTKYSVETLGQESDIELYLHLLSKKRALRRLNSRISRLNRYYNTPSELFARAFELFVTDKDKLNRIAPNVFNIFNNVLSSNEIPLLTNFVKKTLK